jgi:hypothetical protein
MVTQNEHFVNIFCYFLCIHHKIAYILLYLQIFNTGKAFFCSEYLFLRAASGVFNGMMAGGGCYDIRWILLFVGNGMAKGWR